MENIIRSVIEGPLPNILVVSGVLFLFLSVVGKIGTKIDVDPRKQRYAGIIGFILLLVGLGLHLMALVIPAESGSAVQTTNHQRGTNTDIKGINDFKKQISEIDIETGNLEKELARRPQSPGSVHELQDLRQAQEKRLEEIEDLQRTLRFEIKQLHLRATRDPDARRRLEQIEGERIPDTDVERIAVQTQLEELHDMIRNAEERDELRVRINQLKDKKQSLQEGL